MRENLGREAEKAYREGKHREAVELYHKILESEPKDAISHQRLAQTLYGMGDLDKSMAECLQAIELQPNLAIPHLILGKIMGRKGNFTDCEVEIQKAIELNPSLIEAYLFLAAVRAQQENYREAIDILSRAIRLAPEAWRPRHLLALAYYENGQTERAYEEQKYAFRAKPSLKTGYLLIFLFLSRYRLAVGVLIALLTLISIATRIPLPIALTAIFYLLGGILVFRNGHKQLGYLLFLISLILWGICIFLLFG